MRYFSSFTGGGGFDLAMPSDWQCVGFSEIDKYANMVLKYRFPDVKNYGDVNEINWNEIPDFDILLGGTPCQDLSLAGKRKGLSGERSGLFFEFVKALKAKKPEYFIWENVKGALSSNHGYDFAEVLNQFSEAGYSFWWQVLNAKDFGVPQNTERIFIVGFRDRSPPEVFFEPEETDGDDAIQALTATYYKGDSSNHYTKYGSRTLILNNKVLKLSQEAKPIEIAKNKSISGRVYSPIGIAISLKANGGGLGVKTGLYAVQAVLTPDREKKRQNGRRFKNPEEPMFTLTGQDIHGIRVIGNIYPSGHEAGNVYDQAGISPTIKVNGPRPNKKNVAPKIIENEMIRRLTPRECERLMSWPDDWTRWGTDEKGNKIEISDTLRYKMAGNGVVSNVVKWLIENVILRE